MNALHWLDADAIWRAQIAFGYHLIPSGFLAVWLQVSWCEADDARFITPTRLGDGSSFK